MTATVVSTPIATLTPADSRRMGVGATGGIPIATPLRSTAGTNGWATTPRHADRGRGRDGDQVVGGSDPAPGSSDRALRTACHADAANRSAKLRYPAGRLAVWFCWCCFRRLWCGGRWSLQCPHVLPTLGEWTTPLSPSLSPDGTWPARTNRRTGLWPSDPARPRSPIMGQCADRRYWAQRDWGWLWPISSGTVTFLFTDIAGSTALGSGTARPWRKLVGASYCRARRRHPDSRGRSLQDGQCDAIRWLSHCTGRVRCS